MWRCVISKAVDEKKTAPKEAPEKNAKKNAAKDKTVNRKNEKNKKDEEHLEKTRTVTKRGMGRSRRGDDNTG